MKQLFFVFLPFTFFNSYSQIYSFDQAEEYPVVIDSSFSGGIIEKELPAEKYDVIMKKELPMLILNVNELVGLPQLEIGHPYLFEIEFVNPFKFDIILVNIIFDCDCSQPTWLTNTVGPFGIKNISISMLPSTPGSFMHELKVFVQDQDGSNTVGIQRIQLNYSAQ